MFVVLLTYKKPLEEVEKYLAEHRAFLDQGYATDFFLLSGPMNPRTGGVIVSQLDNRDQLESILKEDPFSIYGLADYKIIEFTAVKYHQDLLPAYAKFLIKTNSNDLFDELANDPPADRGPLSPEVLACGCKNWKLKLLFDGACPFCRREIAWMEKRNKNGYLAFEDISASDFHANRYGLTQESVMGVIHGVLHDGRIIKKVDVFIEAYRLLDLAWLVAPLSWPGVRFIANRGYEIFARYRVPIGHFLGARSCQSNTCGHHEDQN